MKKALALLVLVVIFIIPYFALDGERLPLNDQTRSDLSGKFVRLSDGVTHYELGGPDNRPVVVLLHGYSIPMFLWDYVYDDLTQAGFRVLRYDFYGRGYSDRPRTKYDPELFRRQLTELINHLQITVPVDLVGNSMGGAVAVNCAANNPDMVRKVALISPYGFPQKLGFMAELIKTPYLGGYLMAVAGDKVLMGRLPQNFNQPLDYPRIEAAFADQMKYKGYKRALLSSMRNFMNLDFSDDFKKLGQMHKPVLLLWGKADRVIPFYYSDYVQGAMSGVEFHALIDRGHDPMLEKPEEVSRLLINFLKKPTQP